MPDPTYLQLGTGGVLALLIVREVLGFIGKSKNGAANNCQFDSDWKKRVEDSVSQSFCEQRHTFSKEADDERDKHYRETFTRLEKKIDELPRRINGGGR